MKKINYLDEGSGNLTFVWVHGWGGNISSLMSLHSHFKKTHRSIILDNYGFGKSDLPDEDWGTYEWGDNLANFLKSIGANNVIYFGHSFGGALGIYIAQKYPESISKLILCAPSYKRFNKKLGSRSMFYQKIKKYIFPVRYVYYKFRYPNSDALRFPKLEANFAKIMVQDLSGLAENVKIPTLLLWGDQDKSVPLADGTKLNTIIKNSNLKVFKGYSHNLPLVEPEMVWEEIEKWIK